MDAGTTVTQPSLIGMLISALGFPYLVILPLAGLVSFLMALVIVIRGKGPMAAAGLVLVTHAPLLIGIFAALQGIFASYMVIATSPSAPKPAEMAVGVSTALVAPLTALVLMIPGYAVAAIGAFARCLTEQNRERSEGPA